MGADCITANSQLHVPKSHVYRNGEMLDKTKSFVQVHSRIIIHAN